MKRCIVYFSWSNNTKTIVDGVNAVYALPTYRIEKLRPYSKDYNTCAYVQAKGEWERRELPSIKPLGVDFKEYEEIVLFFPIWWYTYPMPVATFLKSLGGYKGRIVLCENSYTNDPQYKENVIKDVKALNPSLNLIQGPFNESLEKHISFLKEER